eukprot:CAMPEP_0203672206 /NCGR_PEP_ID=MMETSP0090-20130426/7774_1 /ASSEMBLY_ACC=CAM_ASM_001088 /TAXON_ID=426623 /ORGANISM="Chaetoceros affinis, Strain CCMP159" /LENGTH=2044 /DNA_ID=CAMNT_0050537473 /DNA_START=44 /DNA_END=6178 /DNA_ORIENTATION=-
MRGSFDAESGVKIDDTDSNSSTENRELRTVTVSSTAKQEVDHLLNSAVSVEEKHANSASLHTTDQSEYRPASCFQQTRALIAKNVLNKVRTPVGTLLEIISPALFMWVLVIGYGLSEERFRNMGSYAKWNFNIPNEVLGSNILSLLDEGLNGLNPIGGRQRERTLLEQKMSRLDFLSDYDKYDNEEEESEFVDNSNGHLFQWKDAHQLVRMLQSIENTTEEVSDDDFSAGYETVAGSFEEFRRELRKLLRSPMPIPTIAQYLTLSQSLSSAFNPNELDLVYQTSDYIRRWGNLLTLGTIHLSPRGEVTEDFINYLNDVHDLTNISSSEVLEDRPNATSILLRVHDDADTATQYVMDNLDERTFVSINFHEVDDNFNYTIRMNSTTLPNTNEITRWVSIGLNTRYERYYFSGHLTIQRTVNEFAIWRSNSNNDGDSRKLQTDQCPAPETESWEVYTLPMPTPAYSQNPFFASVGYLLGLVIAMSFLYPISRLIKAMVEEKETRMKETLSILGVHPLAQWLSWAITSSLSSLIIAILVTFTLSLVMRFSSRVYLFFFILFFSFATAGFAFFIAAFFSRANLAAIVGPVALFITILPRWIFFGTNRYEAIQSKKWASLLPCTAFAFGADILSDFEYAQVGVQRTNVNDGEYSFNTALGFLFFDSILYMILGWYLEQIIPRQYGVAKKWYFLILPSFWKEVFPFLRKNDRAPSIVGNQEEDDIEDGTIEGVNADAKLRIENLVKIYNPKKPPAINNLNLSTYDSEITCLLGHNGAGKSSTISVLTGLYPPTSGDCTIYGKSILNDMQECRQSMGICPQQNVLFNNLTVLEHLQFFERIKGVSESDVKERAKEVGLGDFFHTKAGQLSGGNKRKLQLAIALAGEPKLVLLDEPTSGMDPYSRRSTWELLRHKRRGRIILLTTHFMDEAEVLADRVAILKEGSLQCCGSVLWLKQRFGLGYNITFVVDKSDNGTTSIPIDEVQHSVQALLERSLPGTRFIRASARELVFRFPPGSETNFPTVFDDIEKGAGKLHINSYGVSNTSLEEVFLELGDQDDQNINEFHANLDETQINSFEYMNALSQIYLLINKRFTVQRRDLKGLFFKIVLPVILISMVLMVLLIDVPVKGTPIELTPELYSKSGSGASIGNNVIVGGSRSRKKDTFLNTLDGFYPSVTMETHTNLSTSLDVSDFVLDELENGSRKYNFGSFIFGDTIDTTLNINWTELNSGEEGFGIEDLLNIVGSDVETSLIIDAINETLISQNVTGAENLTSALFEIISGSDNLSELVNDTLTLLNLTIDDDELQEFVLDNLFNGTENITVEGDGWTLFLTEGQVLSALNNGFDTYKLNVEVPVSILHNSSSSHSVAVFTQTYYDHLYKQCTQSTNSKLSAINQPLPLTSQQSTEIRTILSIIASILLAIPFNYIPAAFAVFMVKERAVKSKHLQLVSGVDMLSYWTSAYLWDMILYMLLSILTMVAFLSFGEVSAVFTGTVARFFCTWSMVVGYGMSSLPFAYLLSRLFDNPPNAQISIMIIFFITGFVATNAYLILDSIDTTKELAKILRPIFRTWPAYNLGEGMLNLASNFWQAQISSNAPSPFGWEACGRQLLLLYALAPPYFIWLMLLEYSSDGGSGGRFGRAVRTLRASAHNLHNVLAGFKQVSSDEIDDDVMKEKEAVREGKEEMIKSSPILIAELWKTYPKGSLVSALFQKIFSFCRCCKKSNATVKGPKVAVNNLSLHVDNGVTFGLLGVNGAGKTTTMGILTGDVTPTSGDAFIAGHDVTGRTKDGVQFARKNIGFCPQIDPLLDLMTGRETLTMFGKLRGIPDSVLDDSVTNLLESLTLTPHADKVSENYSGGNKRKLSLGIALIGNPKVLFIDESSSGMDPAARRRIWDLIAEAAKDRAVILTTHSMEEAEALCNKVAIMINGKIRCLGGVQHLKQKFLGGYTLSMSCKTQSSEGEIDDAQSYVLRNIAPGATLSERHGAYLKFEVPAFDRLSVEGVKSLGSLFGELQQLVDDASSAVVSYSVSQCTLEQIFINLVRDENNNNNTAVD